MVLDGEEEEDEDEDEGEEEDVMLQAALAMSRGGVEHSAAALQAARQQAMAQLGLGMAGGFPGMGGFAMGGMQWDPDFDPDAGRPAPHIPGLWQEMLQCVSAEALDISGLGEGDKVLLPPSALQRLMELIPQQFMPAPLLFGLSVFGVDDGASK